MGESRASPSPGDDYMWEAVKSEVVVIDPFASDFQRSVFPLMIRRGVDDDGTAEGTAFCVAQLADGQAIFATARHVVECLDAPDDDPQRVDAFLVVPRGADSDEARQEMIPLHVTQAAFSDRYSDVALLWLNVNDGPAAGLELRALGVSLSEPALGDDCVGLGYPQEKAPWQYVLCASSGLVEEVHPRQRDSSLSTFPSFRTNGKYLHGMSGGPIISSSARRVIGVIAHGMEDPTTGYGACLAGIMELSLTLHAVDGSEHTLRGHELISRQIIGGGDDHGSVELTRSPDGVELWWPRTPSAATPLPTPE